MNTGTLITARLKSTRLPMKAMKPIMGRPMVCHKIDRLKLAKRPQRIILCTSTLAQDDPLEEIAAQESIYCFRGHPDDVLLRLTNAAAEFALDVIVSTTADDVFSDSEYVDDLVDFHIRERNDFSDINGLPFGAECYTLSYPAMVRACQIKAETDTEVWGEYFRRTGLFRVSTVQVTDQEVKRPSLRLTVDTSEDFELVSRIFEALHVQGRVFSLKEIVRFCDDHPDLVRLNAHVVQKTPKPFRLKPPEEWDAPTLPFYRRG